MTTTAVRERALTQKQEAFCLRLFKGQHQREAYIAVYHPKGSLGSIDVAASELAHNHKVIVRLNELRDALESPDIGTVRERKKRLTEIYRANLADFVDGEGHVRFSKDIPGHAAVSEYSIKTIGDGEDGMVLHKTLKLRDPVAAIAEQNKMERIGALDTQPPSNQDNRTINIFVNSEHAKQLIDKLSGRLLPPGEINADT